MNEHSALQIAPRPRVDCALAAVIAQALFGVSGDVRELGSHQDRNFRIDGADGRCVLKIANRGWGESALAAQNAAMLHVAQRDPELRAPRPLPGCDGRLIRAYEIDGEALPIRLLSFVEGQPLTGRVYLGPEVIADLGAVAGRTCAALADFEHAGLDRRVQWDLRRGQEVVAALHGSIREPARRRQVLDACVEVAAVLEPLSAALPTQAIHGDATDDNVVGPLDAAGRVRPDGVIDFGDLVRSWRIGELAVTCCSVLRHRPEQPLAVLHAIRAFHARVPLESAEVAALWPLIVLRGAVLVASGEHQAVLDPDNPSVIEPLEDEWRMFSVAHSLPFALAEAAIRDALGLPMAARHAAAHHALAHAVSMFPSVQGFALLDLSSTSDHLHAGKWLDPRVEDALLADAAVVGAAATRHGEFRLSRSTRNSGSEPATCALGVDLRLPPATPVVAPMPATVSLVGSRRLELLTAAGRLVLHGIVPDLRVGAALVAGDRLGAADGDAMRLQLCVEPGLSAPAFATASSADAWRVLCPDPSPLFGALVAAPRDDAHALLERRRRSFARVQVHYYSEPMRIERGWRQHLVDTRARAYLDMVNNVAAIGHGHPRLADAVDRQMRRLNSNSRFHYSAVAELSERLAALAPPGLDTVFLVNSGSEAVDLALRIAQVVTGRMDVVAVREAYHGWTLASDAVTTSLADNPQAIETRPDWVHLAAAPNAYRGLYRGVDAPRAYADDIDAMFERLAGAGRAAAAYIAEPVFGNAGGILLPEGYLASAYAAARRHGGLCIADEVQVGYGRLGHRWWGHEDQGVVPDLITIAKAMGNGHPLGAVITTRAIADAFSAQGSFFSSAGGSPVSCVAGLTVLDVIRDEGLQANAAAVGDHLQARCLALMADQPLIGAVHGMGLYMGVELVRDRHTLEPATAECLAICERMRELGVVVQPTGERNNVLKIKPPMCLSLDDADFFVDQLATVLREGW